MYGNHFRELGWNSVEDKFFRLTSAKYNSRERNAPGCCIYEFSLSLLAKVTAT